MLAGLLIGSGARAQEPGCDVVDERAWSELLGRAEAAIAADDPDAHQAVAARVFEEARCLGFVPDPGGWAQFLVGDAAVAHLLGGDWQAPLATALRIDPALDRGVGEAHEMATWAPPPAAPGIAPVPPGVALYVDGALAQEIPGPDGLHLVQVRGEDGLRSAVLRDQPIPADWLPAARPEPEPEPRRALLVALTGGVNRFAQVVDAPGTYAADAQDVSPEYGVSLGGYAGGTVGIAGDVLLAAMPRVDGSVVVTVGTRSVKAGAGAAAVSANRIEGGVTLPTLLVAPTVAVAAWVGERSTIDLGVEAGWAPPLTRAVARAGWTAPSRSADGRSADGRSANGGAADRRSPWRVRAGIEGRLRSARFVQPGYERALATTDLAALAEVGVVWGAW